MPLKIFSDAFSTMRRSPSRGRQEGQAPATETQQPPKRKRKNKKRKQRRQSFVAAAEHSDVPVEAERPSILDAPSSVAAPSTREVIYRLGRGNESAESLDSEALLDHR